jgi:hypothetical protein
MTTYVENTGQLSDHHLEELNASEIAPEHRDARGYETLYGTDEDRARLREENIPVWAWREDSAFPGLLIPIWRVTGERIGAQFKPAVPQALGDKAVKYATPHGKASRLDVPPLMAGAVRVVTNPLWITEGVKKADALASKGLAGRHPVRGLQLEAERTAPSATGTISRSRAGRWSSASTADARHEPSGADAMRGSAHGWSPRVQRASTT